MTLIVTNKDGIHADERSIDTMTEMSYKEQKLFPLGFHTSAVFGFSGALPKKKEAMHEISNVFGTISEIVNIVDTMKPFVILNNPYVFKQALARFTLLFISGYYHELDCPRLLAITKYHNINLTDTFDIGVMSNALDHFLPVEAFMAIGSSERPAHIFNRAGHDIHEIFARCAQVDGMISRRHTSYERKWLSSFNCPASVIEAVRHSIHATTTFRESMKDLNDAQVSEMILAGYFAVMFSIGIEKRQTLNKDGSPKPYTVSNLKRSYRGAMLATMKLAGKPYKELIDFLKPIINKKA